MFEEIANEVTRQVLTALVPVIAAAIVAVLVQLFRKLKIEISTAQRAQLEAIVADVLREVEEWSRRRLKDGHVVTSDAKLERAVSQVIDLKPDLNYQEASALIHSQLPAVRPVIAPSRAPSATR